MPGVNIDVSLAEALEVRGGPLTESELWAVLCQSAEAMHDLFLNGTLPVYKKSNFIGGLLESP